METSGSSLLDHQVLKLVHLVHEYHARQEQVDNMYLDALHQLAQRVEQVEAWISLVDKDHTLSVAQTSSAQQHHLADGRQQISSSRSEHGTAAASAAIMQDTLQGQPSQDTSHGTHTASTWQSADGSFEQEPLSSELLPTASLQVPYQPEAKAVQSSEPASTSLPDAAHMRSSSQAVSTCQTASLSAASSTAARLMQVSSSNSSSNSGAGAGAGTYAGILGQAPAAGASTAAAPQAHLAGPSMPAAVQHGAGQPLRSLARDAGAQLPPGADASSALMFMVQRWAAFEQQVDAKLQQLGSAVAAAQGLAQQQQGQGHLQVAHTPSQQLQQPPSSTHSSLQQPQQPSPAGPAPLAPDTCSTSLAGEPSSGSLSGQASRQPGSRYRSIMGPGRQQDAPPLAQQQHQHGQQQAAAPPPGWADANTAAAAGTDRVDQAESYSKQAEWQAQQQAEWQARQQAQAGAQLQPHPQHPQQQQQAYLPSAAGQLAENQQGQVQHHAQHHQQGAVHQHTAWPAAAAPLPTHPAAYSNPASSALQGPSVAKGGIFAPQHQSMPAGHAQQQLGSPAAHLTGAAASPMQPVMQSVPPSAYTHEGVAAAQLRHDGSYGVWQAQQPQASPEQQQQQQLLQQVQLQVARQHAQQQRLQQMQQQDAQQQHQQMPNAQAGSETAAPAGSRPVSRRSFASLQQRLQQVEAAMGQAHSALETKVDQSAAGLMAFKAGMEAELREALAQLHHVSADLAHVSAGQVDHVARLAALERMRDELGLLHGKVARVAEETGSRSELQRCLVCMQALGQMQSALQKQITCLAQVQAAPAGAVVPPRPQSAARAVSSVLKNHIAAAALRTAASGSAASTRRSSADGRSEVSSASDASEAAGDQSTTAAAPQQEPGASGGPAASAGLVLARRASAGAPTPTSPTRARSPVHGPGAEEHVGLQRHQQHLEQQLQRETLADDCTQASASHAADAAVAAAGKPTQQLAAASGAQGEGIEAMTAAAGHSQQQQQQQQQEQQAVSSPSGARQRSPPTRHSLQELFTRLAEPRHRNVHPAALAGQRSSTQAGSSSRARLPEDHLMRLSSSPARRSQPAPGHMSHSREAARPAAAAEALRATASPRSARKQHFDSPGGSVRASAPGRLAAAGGAAAAPSSPARAKPSRAAPGMPGAAHGAGSPARRGLLPGSPLTPGRRASTSSRPAAAAAAAAARLIRPPAPRPAAAGSKGTGDHVSSATAPAAVFMAARASDRGDRNQAQQVQRPSSSGSTSSEVRLQRLQQLFGELQGFDLEQL